MAFVVSLIVGFALLDGAARWAVIVAGGLVEVVEAWAMIWYSRRRRPQTGMDALLGRIGVAASECRPLGQVRVMGEIWTATCPEGCAAGEEVEVLGSSGLELRVRPVRSGGTDADGAAR